MSTSTEQAPNLPPGLPNKRTPVLVLAGVTILLVIIVGGSMFWMMHSKSNTPGRLNKATPITKTTATWIPTGVTPPALASFYDTFANNFHGWSVISNGGYYRIMSNNSLILAATNPNSTLVEAVPTITNLDNYVISADFTINQGDINDSVGLYLRGDSTLDHDYRIDINGNNTLDVVKEYLDSQQGAQTTMLVPPTSSSYLKPPGHANTLTALMIGPNITIEINNIVVMTASDPSYTNGQIALFAHHGDTSPKGVTVTFTRVEIDHLASQFMTPTPTPTPRPTATAGQP